MEEKINIGIISTARINYLGILSPSLTNKNICIKAIASHSHQEKIALYAKKFNINKIYSSYHDLLNDKSIDAVYISLPNSYHFRYAKDAIKAKKHVLCEKPITLFFDELLELEKLAIENNVFIMEGLHYHYFSPLIKLVDDIKLHFKNITHIEAFLGFPLPDSNDIRLNATLGGGSFNHLGCYLTHFITWLFPEKKWLIQSFKQEKQFGVDIKTSTTLISEEVLPIHYSFNVSLTHEKIDSWIKIKNNEYEMIINHAFTPTTFYDPINPTKLTLSLITDHPYFKKINYLKNEENKTTYDYQLDYFLKKIKESKPLAEVNKESHLLRSKIIN